MAKLVSQNAVSVLPPTISIKDPATRSFLDSLANILDARSGYTDRDAPERFITAAEFQGLATRAISQAFSGAGALPGDPDGKIPSAIDVQESIGNLAESIRKSLIYQMLEQQITLIDVGQLRERIDAAIRRTDELADGITKTEELIESENEKIYGRLDAVALRIANAEGLIANETGLRVSADEALLNQLSAVILRVAGAEGAIVTERNLRVDADQAIFDELSAVKLRVGSSEGAIATETSVRVTEDRALASAINTLWAEVGGTGSVIQDGSLASATPNSTQATKWRQVQSAVTDPNTGLVASAAMREDFTTYASNVDGRFNSLYSVRAQLSTGGIVLSGLAKTGPTASLAGSTVLRLSANAPVGIAPGMYAYGTGLDGVTTVVGISGAEVTLSGPLGLDAAGAYTFTTNKMLVGGFGLAATGDSGSSQGGTIDFGVRADRFFIAATSETPNAATQIAQGSSIPFMVLTSPQAVNGVVYQPGVYLKKAVIGNATIGEAQIADLAVTNAKIGETIQSNNFLPGFAGWRITKSGLAEFNDVIIRRASLIASGYTARSDIIYGSYQSGGYTGDPKGGGSGGTVTGYYPPGSFIRGPTFYIETGFTDFEAVANTYAAGFYGRIDSPSNGLVTPGGLSGNVYELAFDVIAAPARTWAIIGSGTPGQRIVLCVTPIIKVLQSFSSVTVNNYNWALFRQR